MNLKRVLLLCLAMVFVVGCLASCAAPTAEELVSKSEEALADAPYKIDVSMTFTGDQEDEIVSAVISQMNSTSMTTTIDGEKFAMAYGMSFDSGFGVMSVDVAMIILENEMYATSSYLVDGEGDTVKMKTSFTEEQREQLMSELGEAAYPSVDVTALDFESVSMEKKEDVYVITCSGLKTESAEKLYGVFGGLGMDSETLAISDVAMEVEVKDGKYQKATVSCNYIINDETLDNPIELGASIVMTFSYENITVTAPADASEYEEVDISDLI